jgi:bifunctional enzyme CysN/CysC
MGKAPMLREKRYAIKIGAARTPLKLVKVLSVLDASDLTSEANKQQVDRHDVGECILETHRPVAFDLSGNIPYTGRFVVVDNYEIAGAGVVLERIETDESTIGEHVKGREFGWSAGTVDAQQRIALFGHAAKFVVFIGDPERAETLAKAIERCLVAQRFNAYYLRMANVVKGLDADLVDKHEFMDEHVRRLGELARILTDSGMIFITSLAEADGVDIRTLELLNKPNEILVVGVGNTTIEPERIDLSLAGGVLAGDAVEAVCALLRRKNVILDYQI